MPKRPEKKFMPPKAIGACADLLYTTRQRRLAEEQPRVRECEEIEKALKDYLIATLPKSESKGAVGKLAKVIIVPKNVPTVEDWEALYAFIKKKGRFDLLGRRLNDAAVEEMWDRGEKVPGVGVFSAVGVSVTKL